jgi:NAD(P)-dependent dehydrogenase (short-subunit alcohol dehydrogenase family)
MWNLEDHTAIVTGAGNGIGSATAQLLAVAGVQVIAADIESKAVNATCDRIKAAGGVARPFTTDVSDAESVQKMVDFAMSQFGAVDILFANAAIQLTKPAAEVEEAEWERLFAVNLKGVFLCCRSIIPSMRSRKRGAIVISASGHAFATYRGFSAYAATKGAAVAFMRGLALDYAIDGIRANCVIPGATDTRLLQSYFDESSDPEAARKELIDQIPMHRLATPEDVAKAVLFLVSDYASYITGTCLAVDGGLMAQG